MRTISRALAALAILALAFAGICFLADAAPSNGARRPLVPAEFLKVTDGDTIRVLLDGDVVRVRLIGIDAPEAWKKRGSKWVKNPDPYSLEAAEFTQELLEKRDIWLEFDVEHKDRYGRTLAYVWAKGPDDKAKLLVNAQIMRAGYAQLLTIPPNVKYVDRFKAALEAAKRDHLNLWAEIE